MYLTFDVYQKTSRRYGAVKRLAIDRTHNTTHVEAGTVTGLLIIAQSDGQRKGKPERHGCNVDIRWELPNAPV